MNHSSENPNFLLRWNHLSYTVTNSLKDRVLLRLQGFNYVPKSKAVLHDMSGEISSGQLVAVMGPSGAGKSTLLECVVDRRVKGRAGDIFLTGENMTNIKVSFIAQNNRFLSQLTVRESILFAARIQLLNCDTKKENLSDIDVLATISQPHYSDYCRWITEEVISNLGLDACENNRLNNCSGGQLKRIAIAEQLVGKPNILVLDEPTSGLDSESCFQVVQLLRNLSEQNMAVIASIHQPSFKVLNLFHKLYVIASKGDCIFENSPLLLKDEIMKHGLECPTTFNPADFIMEVACGEHGSEIIELLTNEHRKAYETESNFTSRQTLKTKRKNNPSHSTWKHSWILFQRSNLVTIRDPVVFAWRLLLSIVIPLFMTTVLGSHVGIRGGCAPKFDADFEPSQLDHIGNEIKDEFKDISDNIGNVFLVIGTTLNNAVMATALGFPSEMITFKAEKENDWYSTESFFYGKMASELPVQVINTLFFWSIAHFFQNQIPEMWRLHSMLFFLFINQIIAQSFAYMGAALFMYNIPAAVFLIPCACFIPFALMMGLLIKFKNMTSFKQMLAYLSYVRFVFEGAVISLYGFGRCASANNNLNEGRDAFVVWMSAMLGVYNEDNEEAATANATNSLTGVASEKFVEELIDSMAGDFISESGEVRSLVMNLFDYQDWYLYRAVVISLAYAIITRIMVYCVIKYKVK